MRPDQVVPLLLIIAGLLVAGGLAVPVVGRVLRLLAFLAVVVYIVALVLVLVGVPA